MDQTRGIGHGVRFLLLNPQQDGADILVMERVAAVETRPDRRVGERTPAPLDPSAADRFALGRALEARAEDVARLTARRAFPGVETNDADFSSSVLATRLIGRWLATGEKATEEEHDALARNGESPLVGGAALAALTKSYLAWRQATTAVIREEAARLGLGREIVEMAIGA